MSLNQCWLGGAVGGPMVFRGVVGRVEGLLPPAVCEIQEKVPYVQF